MECLFILLVIVVGCIISFRIDQLESEMKRLNDPFPDPPKKRK